MYRCNINYETVLCEGEEGREDYKTVTYVKQFQLIVSM